MKLVIDISEGSYNTIKECYERGELLTTICMQIATGTPYEERPQGEWVKVYSDLDYEEYQCSICGRVVIIYKNVDKKELLERYPFCHCGADMRKGGAVNDC